VKELGPGEIKPSSDSCAAATAATAAATADGGADGSCELLPAQKSDLALLHNANVGYLSHQYFVHHAWLRVHT